MKKQLAKTAGLLCYMMFITLLFNFNWLLLIKPRPFLSVVVGMVILTVSKYKKGYTKEELAVSLRWNLLFASFLTTLVSILSFTSSGSLANMAGWQLTESLLPMLYGSVIFLILSILFNDSLESGTRSEIAESIVNVHDLADFFIAERVFREFELTNRECHVALKLLENISNKEIAAELYISESTVKKHIQNIYQKLGAADRNNFKEIYFQTAKVK